MDNEYESKNIEVDFLATGRRGVLKTLRWEAEIEARGHRIKGFNISVPIQQFKIEIPLDEEDGEVEYIEILVKEITIDGDTDRVPLEPYSIELTKDDKAIIYF